MAQIEDPLHHLGQHLDPGAGAVAVSHATTGPALWCIQRARVINRAMSCLPDSGWLRALDLKASTAAAVSVACWAVFGLAEFDLLYLGVLPTWVRAAFVIVALLALSLWLARVWEWGSARFTGWRQRRAILAELDKLSTSEAEFLADRVEKNERTFDARFDSSVAAGLRRKRLALPSATGHPLGYPHTIPDFVWSELKRRRGVEEKREALSGSAARPPARA